MKLAYKYYRWRARRAKTQEAVELYRLKAYRHMGLKFGEDITGMEDSQKYKDESTKDGPKLLHGGDHTFSERVHYNAGRFTDGLDEDGHTVWKETQSWWADSKAANEQHMPSRLTKQKDVIGWTFNKETGRREYIAYNYAKGKQEKLD